MIADLQKQTDSKQLIIIVFYKFPIAENDAKDKRKHLIEMGS